MKRGGYLKRKTPLRARKPRRQPAPEQWWNAFGPCAVCPALGEECDGRIERHHAISRSAFRRHSLEAYEWDPRGRVFLCTKAHDLHTRRIRPLRRGTLPESVFELAEEIGMTWWLEGAYPE